jgi:hypothetical protein
MPDIAEDIGLGVSLLGMLLIASQAKKDQAIEDAKKEAREKDDQMGPDDPAVDRT